MNLFAREERKSELKQLETGRKQVKEILKTWFNKKRVGAVLSVAMAATSLAGNHDVAKTTYGHNDAKTGGASTQEKLSAAETKQFKERIKGYDLFMTPSTHKNEFVTAEGKPLTFKGGQTNKKWAANEIQNNQGNNALGNSGSVGLSGYGQINPGDTVLAIIDGADVPNLPDFHGRVVEDHAPQDFSTDHATMVVSAAAAVLDQYKDDSQNIKIKVYNVDDFVTNPINPDFATAVKGAYDAAIKDGADVISTSIGQDQITDDVVAAYQSIAEEAREKDVILVAAAGNSGHNYRESAPADIPGFIAVGALNKDEQPTSFTSGNEAVKLADLGQDVAVYEPDGTKVKADGTSFAAPRVAAKLAIIKNFFKQGGAKVTTNRFKKLIYSTAKDVFIKGKDIVTGYGMVDMEMAVRTPFPDEDRDIETPNMAEFKTEKIDNGVRVSFRALDESKIVTDNTKVYIGGIDENGKQIPEKEITCVKVGDKFVSDLIGLSDGEYSVDIKNLEDSEGNKLEVAKRFFSNDTKPVQTDINTNIVDDLNGIENSVVFNIHATDNFSINSIVAFVNDPNEEKIPAFISMSGAQAKEEKLTYSIDSSKLQEGQNTVWIESVDTAGNVTKDYYVVTKKDYKIVSVEKMENGLR